MSDVVYYAGIDVSGYPGDDFMAWAWENANLAWTGFYLRAPSHPDAAWMTKRATLAAMGWGFLPIFVGQQVEGAGSHTTTSAQGIVDAAIAVERMRTAGFAPASRVYLDLENGPPAYREELAYVSSWVQGVRGAGYRAGVYCSHLLAQTVEDAAPEAKFWCFRVDTVAETTFESATFPVMPPTGCGFDGAVAWQHRQNVRWLCDAPMLDSIVIDMSVSRSLDPSSS